MAKGQGGSIIKQERDLFAGFLWVMISYHASFLSDLLEFSLRRILDFLSVGFQGSFSRALFSILVFFSPPSGPFPPRYASSSSALWVASWER